MPGLIDENTLNDILARANIVEVISEYIPLKRAGRNFKACCPFHQEKTASFVVSLEKQIYHCFGCGAGGNVFNFLMQYERLEFPEAVELLAKKTGVLLARKTVPSARNSEAHSQLHKINGSALDFYFSGLFAPEGARAREYLIKRGISQETAKLFRLGYARQSWDALAGHLRKNGASLGLIEKAGLVVPKDGGGFYDRFRNRIIFPIFDIRSNPIGFGARVLDSSLPKYINSPETPVYRKGHNLYGLNLAKEAIRESDFVAVVEGYLDCIVPYQHGLRNICASLGTALTPEQARLIKRYTHNVVMVYDGDLAGEMATLRSLDIFIEEEMNVRIAALPSGYDPDTFVRKSGIESFKELVNASADLFDYQFKVLGNKFDPRDSEGKARIASIMLPTIRKIRNSILRDEYIRKLSHKLSVDESFVRDLFNSLKSEEGFSEKAVTENFARLSRTNPTEKLLMKLMLEEAELVSRIKGKVEPDDFQDKLISSVVSTMFDLATQGKSCSVNNLLNYLDEDELSRMVCESTFMPEVSALEKEKVVDDCILRLKKNKAQARRKKLQDEIKNAEASKDELKLNRLKEEFNLLIKNS